MSDDAASGAWRRAVQAARALALDPAGLGGVDLRAPVGPVRDTWLDVLRSLVGETALRRMPANIEAERLGGGLDLAATLARGAPVTTPGFLAESEGRIVLAATAERLPAGTAALLAGALDAGSRIAFVALDEGDDAEQTPAALRDRLALSLDLQAVMRRDIDAAGCQSAGSPRAGADIEAARALLPRVRADEAVLSAFCAAAVALGIGSLRAPLHALRVARCLAALAGRDAVSETDARDAAALVLAPRATQAPAAPDESPAEEEPPRDEPPADPAPPEDTRPLDDVVLEAARAALPAHLLARLAAEHGGAGRNARERGKVGARLAGAQHGRRIGARAGFPRGGAKLDLVATLRAAAPWQRLRAEGAPQGRLAIRRDDLRVLRFEQRTRTTTIFLVDASGSSARERLAEAKGAVRLMLADCYVRRDEVALLAFRGTAADLLLPPTRSLVRAERALAALPGGGGTPLAAALDAAAVLAGAQRRAGRTPTLILMTDGRANVARDGTGGRVRAHADALAAARAWSVTGIAAALLDTSAAPGPLGAEIAAAMGARYVPLPFADARGVDKAARALSRGGRR